jgi:hypothetical protein
MVGDVVHGAGRDRHDLLHGRFLLGFLDGSQGVGDQQGGQDADDRDDDQQLDECEASHLLNH